VTGAGGALGAMQVQLAVAAGAEVTAVARPSTTRNCGNTGRGRSSQIHLTPTACSTSSPTGSAARHWPPRSERSAPGGTIVLGSGNPDKTPINIYDFFGHEGARLVGYLSYAHPDPPGPDLATLTHLVTTGRLDPPIGLLDTWTRLPEAITALTERRISGKAVLTTG
jgi:NADPH2:quinone reductase